MASDLQWFIERLRNSGLSPSFVAPTRVEPPPQLKSDKRTVTRHVGRHSVTVNTVNDKGGGDAA